jgi:SPP1 gp7 family putative phage head morphogenesis protein
VNSHARALELFRQVQARRLAHRSVTGRNAPRRRQGRLKRPAPLTRIQLSYFRALKAGIVGDLRSALEQHLVPELGRLVREEDQAHGRRQDAAGEDLHSLLERVSKQILDKWPVSKLEDLAARYASETSQFQKAQLLDQIKSAVGVNVLGAEPNLRPLVQSFTRENVALIRSIPTDAISDLSKRLIRQINDGARAEDLADVVQERLGVSESRAALIARDQIGKFNGSLNQARQTELGVTRYIWRTMRDNRVRDEHALREGETFEWDKPPEDGNPGEAVNCRCYAEPDLEHVLNGLESGKEEDVGPTLGQDETPDTSSEVEDLVDQEPAAPIDPEITAASQAAQTHAFEEGQAAAEAARQELGAQAAALAEAQVAKKEKLSAAAKKGAQTKQIKQGQQAAASSFAEEQAAAEASRFAQGEAATAHALEQEKQAQDLNAAKKAKLSEAAKKGAATKAAKKKAAAEAQAPAAAPPATISPVDLAEAEAIAESHTAMEIDKTMNTANPAVAKALELAKAKEAAAPYVLTKDQIAVAEDLGANVYVSKLEEHLAKVKKAGADPHSIALYEHAIGFAKGKVPPAPPVELAPTDVKIAEQLAGKYTVEQLEAVKAKIEAGTHPIYSGPTSAKIQEHAIALKKFTAAGGTIPSAAVDQVVAAAKATPATKAAAVKTAKAAEAKALEASTPPSFTDHFGQRYTEAFEATSARMLKASRAQVDGPKMKQELRGYTVNSTRLNAFNGGSYDPTRDPSGNTEAVRQELRDRTKKLDAAIAKTSAPEDVVVYRAMEHASLEAGIKPGALAETDYSPGDAAKKAELLAKYIGRDFIDPVYGSTSLDSEVAQNFMKSSRVMLRIKVPKGSAGFWFNGDSDLTRYTNESELLLPRNTRYRVVGVAQRQRAGNTVSMLDVEIIPPEK